MRKVLVLALLIAGSFVTSAAVGQSSCAYVLLPSASVAVSATTPPHAFVTSRASFNAGTAPYSPTIERTGNDFMITYLVPTAGPAVGIGWQDTIDIGPVSYGAYTVTVSLKPAWPPDASACLLASSPFEVAPQVELVLPGVVGRALGAAEVDWASEIRVTNPTAVPKNFTVVDWIGTPGWRPKSWAIGPGEVVSISGFELINHYFELPYSLPSYGAAVASAEPGLSVQIQILAGVARGGPLIGTAPCPSWAGGYPTSDLLDCNSGAGPVLDAGHFFPSDSDIALPWLSTDTARRVNLCLINPDPDVSTVAVSVFAADGAQPYSGTLSVPAHGLIQVNDVFSADWLAVREHNADARWSAARAVLHGTTRLYALAYVISNLNNTVGVSVPPGP